MSVSQYLPSFLNPLCTGGVVAAADEATTGAVVGWTTGAWEVGVTAAGPEDSAGSGRAMSGSAGSSSIGSRRSIRSDMIQLE